MHCGARRLAYLLFLLAFAGSLTYQIACDARCVGAAFAAPKVPDCHHDKNGAAPAESDSPHRDSDHSCPGSSHTSDSAILQTNGSSHENPIVQYAPGYPASTVVLDLESSVFASNDSSGGPPAATVPLTTSLNLRV
jgi:hypothetical protein